MTREQVRQYVKGHKEAERISLELRRAETYADRLKKLEAIYRRMELLGHCEPKPFDPTIYERWQRIRKAYFERQK